MNLSRVELINQHLDSFPVLPTNVMRLIQVTGNPECSVSDVVEVIQADQSLSLTILKFANSVLFGRPQKVETIKMAVVILGFNEVQRIAMAKALLNSFNKIARQHKSVVDGFWHHSFVCGVGARHIATELGAAGESAFMGGLIHDIGKLIMLETFNEDYPPERWMTGLSDEEKLNKELHFFSFTHDMLGAQLLQKWLFPESLISTVACHHRPAEASGRSDLAAVVQLADILAFYSCNQDFQKDGDILEAIKDMEGDFLSDWRMMGLSFQDGDLVSWYDWLLENLEQIHSLRQTFSS